MKMPKGFKLVNESETFEESITRIIKPIADPKDTLNPAKLP